MLHLLFCFLYKYIYTSSKYSLRLVDIIPYLVKQLVLKLTTAVCVTYYYFNLLHIITYYFCCS